MLVSRDLLHERSMRRPTQPTGPPPAKRPLVDTVEAAMEASFDPVFHTVMAANMSDAFADHLVMVEEDYGCIKAMQCGTGMFFNTGYLIEDSAVWKKLGVPDDLPDMFIFRCEGGWYCSSVIFPSEEDIPEISPEPIISWWTKGSDEQHWPGEVPVNAPYWSKTVHSEIFLHLGHRMLVNAETELREVAQASISNAAVEAEGKGGGANAATEGKAKGKGGHGGWMPRTASMISAIYSSDWDEAQRLADRYMAMSQALRALVRG